MAFPSTGILDTFDRANEGPPPSASWSSAIGAAGGGWKVVSNACAVDGLGVAGAATDYWNPSTFHADVEAFMTITTLPADTTSVNIFARGVQLGATTADAYSVYAERNDAGNDVVGITRITNAAGTILGTPVTVTLQANDAIGIQVIGSTIRSWYKPTGGSWTKLDTQTDATYASAGNIGIIANNTSVVINDFGGGAVVYDASTTKSSITVRTGATTASKRVLKDSSLSKQLISLTTNTVTASKGVNKTSSPAKSSVTILVNTTTASKVSSKTATITQTIISITTGVSSASSGQSIDTKTSSTIQQLISVITNATTASKNVNKTAFITQALVSIITNTITASKVNTKSSSPTSVFVRVSIGETTASIGALVDNKTGTITSQVIQIVTNSISASKTSTKSASTTTKNIRITTNSTTGNRPGTNTLGVKLLMQSRLY